MPKNTISILGLVIAVLPFLGFPGSFKAPAFFLLGLGVAYLSFEEHRHKRRPHAIRRVNRKQKGAVSLSVNETGKEQKDGGVVITSLVEPNEEDKAST